ncbi:MAG: hypothetical protein ABR568_08710 [Pyrinomonadaceae bacterium]
MSDMLQEQLNESVITQRLTTINEYHSTTEQEAVATWPLRQTQIVLVVPRRPGRYRFLFCS